MVRCEIAALLVFPFLLPAAGLAGEPRQSGAGGGRGSRPPAVPAKQKGVRKEE